MTRISIDHASSLDSAMVVLGSPSMFEPSLAAFVIAVALDVCFGEPCNVVHPVAWMGKGASFVLRLAPRADTVGQLLFGVLVAVMIPATFAGASVAISWAASYLGPVVALVVAAWLLKSMFAIRALGVAATNVRDCLAAGRLAQARHGLASLCSRDASMLEESLIVAGTVESLAENTSDSIVAPFFYYVLLGLPGVAVYRAVNTLDAMIGYHGRYEYLGKAAARLDDALNFVPARITAVLLLLAGGLAGGHVRGGWRVLGRDGGTTESPNAGRPMAVMAGLLGVQLVKQGHYRLGDPTVALQTTTIDRAWRIVLLCSGFTFTCVTIAIAARHVYLG